MKFLLIFAMAVFAIVLIGVLGLLAWLVIDFICARFLRFPGRY